MSDSMDLLTGQNQLISDKVRLAFKFKEFSFRICPVFLLSVSVYS